MRITKQTLQVALAKCWTRQTSSVPGEWTEENPSRGQCVPTALVAQDYVGGELQKLTTTYMGHRETHYRNVLTDGAIFDACREQYPVDQELHMVDVNLGEYSTVREKLLSDPDVRRRYNILRQRVNRIFYVI